MMNDEQMHADVHGAATVVIRNYMSLPAGKTTETHPESGIALLSLQQAAVFSLCHSVSWDNNLINKVYWVHSHQVSKTAPTGEYLPTGSFMIRGKKNFLTPFRLEMGLCLLFQVSDQTTQRHRYERRRRDLTEEEWDEVIAKGCVSGVESAVDQLVEDERVGDDDDDDDDDANENENKNEVGGSGYVEVVLSIPISQRLIMYWK